MRIGIRQLINSAWPESLIDEAETIDQACAMASRNRPDAIVLDLLMPGVSGTEGVVRMLQAAPRTPILVMSFNAE